MLEIIVFVDDVTIIIFDFNTPAGKKIQPFDEKVLVKTWVLLAKLNILFRGIPQFFQGYVAIDKAVVDEPVFCAQLHSDAPQSRNPSGDLVNDLFCRVCLSIPSVSSS